MTRHASTKPSPDTFLPIIALESVISFLGGTAQSYSSDRLLWGTGYQYSLSKASSNGKKARRSFLKSCSEKWAGFVIEEKPLRNGRGLKSFKLNSLYFMRANAELLKSETALTIDKIESWDEGEKAEWLPTLRKLAQCRRKIIGKIDISEYERLKDELQEAIRKQKHLQEDNCALERQVKDRERNERVMRRELAGLRSYVDALERKNKELEEELGSASAMIQKQECVIRELKLRFEAKIEEDLASVPEEVAERAAELEKRICEPDEGMCEQDIENHQDYACCVGDDGEVEGLSICCDMCDQWFHLKCLEKMGSYISEQRAKEMKNFVCAGCATMMSAVLGPSEIFQEAKNLDAVLVFNEGSDSAIRLAKEAVFIDNNAGLDEAHHDSVTVIKTSLKNIQFFHKYHKSFIGIPGTHEFLSKYLTFMNIKESTIWVYESGSQLLLYATLIFLDEQILIKNEYICEVLRSSVNSNYGRNSCSFGYTFASGINVNQWNSKKDECSIGTGVFNGKKRSLRTFAFQSGVKRKEKQYLIRETSQILESIIDTLEKIHPGILEHLQNDELMVTPWNGNDKIRFQFSRLGIDNFFQLHPDGGIKGSPEVIYFFSIDDCDLTKALPNDHIWPFIVAGGKSIIELGSKPAIITLSSAAVHCAAPTQMPTLFGENQHVAGVRLAITLGTRPYMQKPLIHSLPQIIRKEGYLERGSCRKEFNNPNASEKKICELVAERLMELNEIELHTKYFVGKAGKGKKRKKSFQRKRKRQK